MRLALLATAALCVSSLAAHASTISYQIYAPLSDGGLFTGVFTYNSTNVFASTLTSQTTASSTAGTITGKTPDGESFGPGYSDLFFFENTGYGVNLVFPGSTFNGMLCTTASTDCGGQPSVIGASANFLGSTKVTEVVPTVPSSVTPEPSSIALLSTGLLGIAGMARKRFV